mgnify:FL=1
MKRKHYLIWACVLLIVLSVMVSSWKFSSRKEEDSSREEAVVVGIGSETGGLDPAGNIALTYLTYSVTALDELLTYNESGEIEYRAADSYEVNEDFTEWTFHLRKDGRWSDGSFVTAKDFLNTIQRALDPKSGSGYANYLFPIKNAEEIYMGEQDMETLGVSVEDDYTIHFSLFS